MRPIARSTAVLAVPLFLFAAAGCSAGRLDHGKVFVNDRTDLTVKPGQTFSVRWTLNVTPGNDWKAVAPAADPAVVSFVGEDRISADQNQLGDGGELYLVFKAGKRGSTELALENCFDCTGALRETYHDHKTYRVTVG